MAVSIFIRSEWLLPAFEPEYPELGVHTIFSSKPDRSKPRSQDMGSDS
jgi:hypothetical protein